MGTSSCARQRQKDPVLLNRIHTWVKTTRPPPQNTCEPGIEQCAQRKALIASKKDEDQTLSERIASSYIDLGTLQDSLGRSDKARANFKKAVQWGGKVEQSSLNNDVKSGTAGKGKGKEAQEEAGEGEGKDIAHISQNIFSENVNPPSVIFSPPETDGRVNDIRQLAACLNLLRLSSSSDNVLEPVARDWVQAVRDNSDEQERLNLLATDVIREFVGDELKDAKAIAEVMCLAPVLDDQNFRFLLGRFYSGVDQSDLLNVNQLQGLADLIHGANPGYLNSDDLVKILELLSSRLSGTHQQSSNYIYQLTLAISHVLDAMADTKVNGLNREKLHTPLSSYLDKLRGSSDPYLVFQAAYAYQALQYVPDDETPWQAAMRRTGSVIQGVSGLVSAVKGFDLNGFMEGLGNIQQGMAGATEVFKVAKTAYKDAMSLAKGGKDFIDSLKESFSFDQKRSWYTALRGADTLIRDGHLVKFKTLVCEAPCRREVAFQWGVCQRLGEIAGNSLWSVDTRQNAVAFLEEIYRNDTEWGQQVDVKQWILTILVQVSSQPGNIAQYATTVLEELRTDGDVGKQEMYQSYRESGPSSYTLKIDIQSLENSPLLDRAQNKPDVEGSLRQLKKRRLEDQKNTIYIPPQAKASLQAPDDALFPLMENVQEFLKSNQHQVLLLLGDSGAGKSTFNKALECELWGNYKKGGTIPLHISLASIDKPDQDMIAKQLRRFDFSEAQIKELKEYRDFILICDGYDESQQTRNLYMTNQLNQPDEWKAKMVISCRSEYIGADYRDRFQPVDRNQSSKSAQLREAVITPFSTKQVHNYIDQYVGVYQPLWKAEEYKGAIDRIPSLNELVGNPFLMTLLLEVLPRMMDPGQDMSGTRVTRVLLYDQFIEQWLERGKRRLGEKDLSLSARAAFDSLSEEGFTVNGIDFLKKLSAAIYKEQDGQPIVEYSRFRDEGSWKSAFFSREDEKYLLREACPLARNGNQYRFIHRSMLEYGVARAIFDPQEWKQKAALQPTMNRRGSMSSVFSFEIHENEVESVVSEDEQEPDPKSPLAWRSFINEPSLLQFLTERVQQEPIFKKQLFAYIEHSKRDKKWRTAAANAITILIRAGVEFRFSDLKGVRIPGADLSNGVFELANFQEADLRKVNLRNSCLRRADLSRSLMTGVHFGELPYLQFRFSLVAITYSTDGTSFAVGLGDGSLEVYETSTWDKKHTLKGHDYKVFCIAYSPNADRIVSGSKDNSVRLWDLTTGECRYTFNGHKKWVMCVAYSSRGDLAASGSEDNTVRVWDLETGECRHILSGHINIIHHVAFSPNGTSIASLGDSTVRLWDVATGSCRYTLSDYYPFIGTVIYSPRGDLIASASGYKSVMVWEEETGKCRFELFGHKSTVGCMAFSPKGNQLASGCADETIRLWDVDTGTSIHTLEGHEKLIRSIAYSRQGDKLASCSDDRSIRLWDTETGECLHTLIGHDANVFDVVCLPSGLIASHATDDKVRLWDVSAGASRLVPSDHKTDIRSVRYSAKRRQIASCGMDGTIRLWNAETGTCLRIMTGHSNDISNVIYSPHEDLLASCSDDNTARLWDVESGTCRQILSGHSDRVVSIAFSPEGDQVATASRDGTVRLWNVETGACQLELTHSPRYGGVGVVAYTPQGDQIVSGASDYTLKIWDVKTGECKQTLTGHTNSIGNIAFSPDGNQMASEGWEDVRLWDLKTGECSHVLSHGIGIQCVVYSPDGHHVASSCQYAITKLWDVKTGECYRTLTDARGSVVYSPKGNFILSGSFHSDMRLFDAKTGECRWKQNLSGADLRGVGDVEQHQRTAGIGWIPSEVDTFITGTHDGSVRVWEVIEGDQSRVRLRWRSTNGRLTVEDTCIQGVEGLSYFNKRLLEQRGAVNEPVLY
ncbi:MAG: hypothetical protein J3Q66DRAFT_386314 [Benniella sp.]|nr:MAG: hypothetical protein J3Q66DRAFT_386314 [Benniella sp.]